MEIQKLVRSKEVVSELGIANLKFTVGSLLACSVDRLSLLVGCLKLGDLLVDSLVLVHRLLYLSLTANSIQDE